MTPRDELFSIGDVHRIWQKYCGFLDLTVREFQEIQEDLLREQTELIACSPLASRIMKGKPKGTTEFRATVPLTTGADYFPLLNERRDDILAGPVHCWTHTSGRGGGFKWVPYTERAVESLTSYGATTIILACARRKGDVVVRPGFRVMYNVPPKPYMPGYLAESVTQLIGATPIPDYATYADADFQTRVKAGFRIALKTGVDVLGSLTSILVGMGERFTEASKKTFGAGMTDPRTLSRLIRALLRAKLARRPILPRDIWPLKGLIGYGTDTGIFREKLVYYWGTEPLEGYAATETGGIATQAWNKRTLTFLPSTCFYEFIPEAEWEKNRKDPAYSPSTVLMDQVEPGRRYEIVVTSFYGMPFLRYRLGDLLQVVSLEDSDAGIRLPQFLFDCRADDLIDIAGFARLDEKTVWQAIVNTGVRYEEWTARKETDTNKAQLRLYIEAKDHPGSDDFRRRLTQELTLVNRDYRDLRSMLGMDPLSVTFLPRGTFERYFQTRVEQGADLAHLKPPHMNASDAVIAELLTCASRAEGSGG
jgi:hypothetical protein